MTAIPDNPFRRSGERSQHKPKATIPVSTVTTANKVKALGDSIGKPK